MSTIGYLGPEGSYSQLAAQKLSRGDIIPYPSFCALIAALEQGETDGIVLPVENSLNGGVMQNLDLLQEAEGLIAVKEVIVPIEHRLLTLKDADRCGITTIYSHSQALGQCAKYIHSHFPDAKLVPTPSTAACVERVRTTADAGIVGAQFSAEGYKLWPECISDEQSNCTQFLYVVKGSPDPSVHSGKIFLCLTCAHRPGALLEVLAVFAREEINMTKIESRPIKDRVGEYRFFIEIEADYSSPEIQSAMNSLRDICNSIKILGCY